MSRMLNGNRTPDSTTDEELVLRCQQGDASAFEALFVRYQRRVYYIVLNYLGDPAECEDLCQEVFIQVYRSIRSFRGDSSFYTWLYRIVVNMTKNCIKQKVRQRHVFGQATEEEMAGVPSGRAAGGPLAPDRELERVELGVVLRRELLALNESFRMALILREVDGLSYEEIADVLKVGAGTVKSRIARGRRDLKKKLKSFI
jgi:RNA polymerase sigma-70 factor (ECF subfamily)